MLVWQLTTWHKKYTFFSKLLLACSVGHTFLLFFIFFLYHRDGAARHIDIAMQESTVMFLPLQKTVASPATAKKTTSSSKGLTIVNAAALDAARNTKKNETAKVAAKTKLVPALKKQPDEEKKAEEKKKEPLHQEAKIQHSPQQTNSPISLEELNNVVYAGQLDREALELREKIRHEIECAWHPPAGIGAGKECKVRVVVDWSGRAQEIIFEESSAVVTFDNSVRHALLTMQFPKAAHGKELIMPFRA